MPRPTLNYGLLVFVNQAGRSVGREMGGTNTALSARSRWGEEGERQAQCRGYGQRGDWRPVHDEREVAHVEAP